MLRGRMMICVTLPVIFKHGALGFVDARAQIKRLTSAVSPLGNHCKKGLRLSGLQHMTPNNCFLFDLKIDNDFLFTFENQGNK